MIELQLLGLIGGLDRAAKRAKRITSRPALSLAGGLLVGWLAHAATERSAG